MKRFQIMLIAAVVFAVGSAFTTAKNSKTAAVDLYWFSTNTAGTVITSPSIPDVAEPLATNRTTCPNATGALFCGRGYTEAQTDLDGSGNRVLKSSTNIISGSPAKKNN
ncbi:hypothetical protein ACLI09_16835 [Flavobacterium sp. RHBU_24]|uniref:hypothetical protein n=1 Tax=Flavobacterium sp. RHBU_24 TaxID=3391185 RepID=UPI00398555ED